MTARPLLPSSAGEPPPNAPPQYAPELGPAHYLEGFVAVARLCELELMPWQKRLAATMTETVEGGRWRYPEIAAVVSRQNGKSRPMTVRILTGLLRGERIGHVAQHRELPRRTFLEVAGICQTVRQFGRLLAAQPRLSNGQEEIRFLNGGRYRIAADTPGGMRGWDNDTLIIDEVREQTDSEFLAAGVGTLTASANPQIIYLSNAGDESSVVLNELRRRGIAGEPGLAYLEWSAPVELAREDRRAWVAANPALGYTVSWANLEANYRALPPERFEVEHLCRWVTSMAPRLVSQLALQQCIAPALEVAHRPVVGLAVDPSSRRASAVAAWIQTDGTVAVAELGEWRGEPVDLAAVAGEVNAYALSSPLSAWAYEPLGPGAELARRLSPRARALPVSGREWIAASSAWVSLVEARRLRLTGGEVVVDMPYVERKSNTDGTYSAVRPANGRPVTAALAAIRAAWVATAPGAPAPRVF